jgi:hypothetical protein
MNRTGVCVPIKSQATTALEVANAVYQELERVYQIPFRRHSSLFALWISSPVLELQLQPLHRPFSVLAQWDQLLRKYANIEGKKGRALIEKDEPILSLQRNVFLRKSEEALIEDIRVLELLYEEAKVNVLDGRYPLQDYEAMAALQAAIDLGPYDLRVHSVDYFRQRLNEYIPSHCKYTSGTGSGTSGSNSGRTSNWFSTVKRVPSVCHRILDLYRQIDASAPRFRLLRKYLEICWKCPFYGSAFFSGQIERPVQGVATLMNHHDCKIWVAINWEGIHLINKKNPELIFSVNYDQFNYQLAFPNNRDVQALPCLFLQFNTRRRETISETKMLQVFSREAQLMDTLIAAFVSQVQEERDPGAEVDATDSGGFVDDKVSTKSAELRPVEKQGQKKKNRLSCATFNEKGECVRKQGSWRLVRNQMISH